AGGGAPCHRAAGVTVAEIRVRAERGPRGCVPGGLDRVAAMREGRRDRGRRPQEALAVAPPVGLAAVERGAVLDGDERVLQGRQASIVRVDVAGRDGLDAERLGQLAQQRVSAGVAPLERPLELDEEAVAAEYLRQTSRLVRVPHREPVPRAARQADETLVPLLKHRLLERRLEQL